MFLFLMLLWGQLPYAQEMQIYKEPIPQEKGEFVYLKNRRDVLTYLIVVDTLSEEVYFKDTSGLGYIRTGRTFPDFPEISKVPVRANSALVRIEQKTGIKYHPPYWTYEEVLDYIYRYKQRTELQLLINTLSIGFLTFLLLFFIFYSFVARQKLYYLYVVYIFMAWLFCLSMPNELPLPAKQFLTAAGIDQDIDETALAWMFIFYIAFSDELLGISIQSKSLKRIFRVCYVGLGLYGFFQLVIGIWHIHVPFLHEIYLGFRLLFLPLYIFILALVIFKVNSPLKTYLLVANGFMLLGALVSVVINYSDVYLYWGENRLIHATFLQLGILAETACFAFALGYHNTLIRKQRDEKERQQFAMERRVNKLTLQAIETQMNPHFLFNGINAVRDLMMKNEKEAAKDYLNTLALLLRSSLMNSRKEEVSLEEELEYVKLYLTIEKLRLGSEFHFEIKCDEELDPGTLLLPSQLLHPIVENAVKHGLRWKEGEKWVKISIFRDGVECWKISIKDNGIGRTKSEELKKADPLKSTGLGLPLVQEKLKLYYNLQGKEVEFEVLDQEGTEVLFTFWTWKK